MIKTSTIEATATPVRVDQSTIEEGVSGQRIVVLNEGPNQVWLGGADVTAGTGPPLAVGTDLSAAVAFPLQYEEQLWAVCDTGGTASLQILEQGV